MYKHLYIYIFIERERGREREREYDIYTMLHWQTAKPWSNSLTGERFVTTLDIQNHTLIPWQEVWKDPEKPFWRAVWGSKHLLAGYLGYRATSITSECQLTTTCAATHVNGRNPAYSWYGKYPSKISHIYIYTYILYIYIFTRNTQIYIYIVFETYLIWHVLTPNSWKRGDEQRTSPDFDGWKMCKACRSYCICTFKTPTHPMLATRRRWGKMRE